MTSLIIAPHVDDEVIGCWSLLNSGSIDRVLYLRDLTLARTMEAISSEGRFGFKAFYTHFKPAFTEAFDGVTRLYLPSSRDNHPDHKWANALGRQTAIDLDIRDVWFYSVDMNVVPCTVLSPSDQQLKRRHLNVTFPSQSELWERDHKYWLFESIRRDEYDYSNIGRINHWEIEITKAGHSIMVDWDIMHSKCAMSSNDPGMMDRLVAYATSKYGCNRIQLTNTQTKDRVVWNG